MPMEPCTWHALKKYKKMGLPQLQLQQSPPRSVKSSRRLIQTHLVVAGPNWSRRLFREPVGSGLNQISHLAQPDWTIARMLQKELDNLNRQKWFFCHERFTNLIQFFHVMFCAWLLLYHLSWGATAEDPLKNDASFLPTPSSLLPIVITAEVHNESLY